MKLLQHHPWLQYLGLFLIIFNFFLLLQIQPVFFDPDGFYHLKMSELISTQGLIYELPWQQYSVLNENYTDHHLLYHLICIPFISIFGSLLGIKIAHSFLIALLFIIIYLILKHLKIKYPWLIFMLLTVPAFVYRINLIKAGPLALLILFLSLYFLLRKKYLYLFICAFIYVWSHGGFIILPIITFIYCLIHFFSKSEISYPLRGRILIPLLPVSGGTLAGLIINPYFPKNLIFYWHQLIQIGLINYQNTIKVGSEWYPYSYFDLIPVNGFIFICLALAGVAFFFYRKKTPLINHFFLFLTILFLAATFKSRRYIEYFIPFAFIWSMLTLNIFWKTTLWKNKYQKIKKDIFKKKSYLIFAIYLVFTIIIIISMNFQMVKNDAENPFAHYEYWRNASNYLQQHTAAGDLVFHTEWHTWPQLFYHNTHNFYLVGLDPTFMYKYDPATYQLWDDLRKGKLKLESSQKIKEDFNSDYIILSTRKNDKLLLAYLQRDPNCELIYTDDQAFIFKIN